MSAYLSVVRVRPADGLEVFGGPVLAEEAVTAIWRVVSLTFPSLPAPSLSSQPALQPVAHGMLNSGGAGSPGRPEMAAFFQSRSAKNTQRAVPC